jgi:N-acetyltransferase
MMALTFLKPTTMSGHGVTLRPMLREDTAALAMAAADGELWKLRFTSVPAPEETQAYVNKACDQMGGLERFAFTVIDPSTGQVIGSSSYHDIIPAAQRLEIGYTWYALSRQRTFVNTACKWLLLNHAFSVIGAQVVGWRTDNFNFASQKAIERLGAKRDGVIRHHAVRRDGTVRDTVMYSLTRLEWEQGVKAHLEWLLGRDK